MAAILAQVGIGVSNLAASTAFYTSTLDIGLSQTQSFETPDFDEVVLSFPRVPVPSSSSTGNEADGGKKKKKIKTQPAAGAELALMQYKNGGPAPKNQQGKLMFYVDDVEAVMERCKSAAKTDKSIKILSDVGEGEGVLEYIGIVSDPDGFLVEFVPMMFLQAAQGGSKL